jgi:hypothetical protein
MLTSPSSPNDGTCPGILAVSKLTQEFQVVWPIFYLDDTLGCTLRL